MAYFGKTLCPFLCMGSFRALVSPCDSPHVLISSYYPAFVKGNYGLRRNVTESW